MSDSNPYQAPESNLNAVVEEEYELNPNWTIGEIFSEAWQLKDGFKGTYWGAALIYAGIAIVATVVTGFLSKDSAVIGFILQIITVLITYPLIAGLTMIAVKRSVGIPTNAFMVLDYYPKTIPLFLLYVLMVIMVMIGLILLILPGIYLMLAYMLAIPLLVDKNMGIWEALETSRKAITPCWFRTFGLLLLTSIILIISAIPLGIGLIWTVPFLGLVMGILYRNLMGVSQSA